MSETLKILNTLTQTISISGDEKKCWQMYGTILRVIL